MDMNESNGKRTYKIWEPLLLAIFTCIGLLAGSRLAMPETERTGIQMTRQDKGRQLHEIVRFIEERYVDHVDAEALINSATSALLQELDPHSGYLSPEEVKDLNEKMEGQFEGIGIEFHRVLDTAIVLGVMRGGPADKAGLKRMDRIVSANDSLLTSPDLTERDMVNHLRGIKEKTVLLKVRRPGTEGLLTISIERGPVTIRSVDAAYMIADSTGFIHIARFSSKTYKEFMDKLEDMVQKQGMRHLIIDVRQNPGGYLKEAVNILSQLFDEKGLLLLYTEGEHAARTEYHTTGKPFYPVGNIAVLIDEGSASASEILAGALQDHDRALVIGTPTYGKGLVQEQYPLSNGGALRLTIARYYTPSGRLIQKPYTNGDAVKENGQTETDTMIYYTGKGRAVGGSGGITPDIMIESPAFFGGKEVPGLYAMTLEFALHGLDVLDVKDNSFEALMAGFPEGDKVVDAMQQYFATSGRSPQTDPATLGQYQDELRTMLMGMIASWKFGQEYWHRVVHHKDPVVRKALELIKDDRRVTLKY